MISAGRSKTLDSTGVPVLPHAAPTEICQGWRSSTLTSFFRANRWSTNATEGAGERDPGWCNLTAGSKV